jgi:hypothetical protein
MVGQLCTLVQTIYLVKTKESNSHNICIKTTIHKDYVWISVAHVCQALLLSELHY